MLNAGSYSLHVSHHCALIQLFSKYTCNTAEAEKLQRSCPHKAEPSTFTEQRSEPQNCCFTSELCIIHVPPVPSVARTWSRPHQTGHIYLPSTAGAKLYRYITLSTGTVVVWVETIPLCQGLVFATRLQKPCTCPDTCGTREIQKTARTVQQQTMMGCHLKFASQQKLGIKFTCRPSCRFTLKSLHARNVQQFGHSLAFAENQSPYKYQKLVKANTNNCICWSNTPNHMCKRMRINHLNRHERMTCNLCSCHALSHGAYG